MIPGECEREGFAPSHSSGTGVGTLSQAMVAIGYHLEGEEDDHQGGDRKEPEYQIARAMKKRTLMVSVIR